MFTNLKTKVKLLAALALAFSLNANAWTIGTNNLLDLRNLSGTSQYNISDDGKSAAVSLGFNFDFYGVTYNSGTISTNGCFRFQPIIAMITHPILCQIQPILSIHFGLI